MRGLKFGESQEKIIRRSRTPQGVRGLKSRAGTAHRLRKSRTPQGVRGLKYRPRRYRRPDRPVAPRKGCVD